MEHYKIHKYYKTCLRCGSNLDLNEYCDCYISRCIKCGNELKWGKFAHNQEVCWDCYELACLNAINDKIEDEEVKEYLLHAMRIVAIYFNTV